MEDINGKEILDIANKVAAKYRKKMALSYDDYEEVKAEAALTILKCRKTYKPEKGNFRTYAYSAANRRIGIFLCHMNSPISTPDSKKYLQILCSAKKVPVNAIRRNNTEHMKDSCKKATPGTSQESLPSRLGPGGYLVTSPRENGHSSASFMDDSLSVKMAMSRLRSMGIDPENSPEGRVIVCQESAKNVAQKYGIEVKEVYRRVRKARVKIRKDKFFKELI